MSKPDLAIVNGYIIDGSGDLGFRGHVVIDSGKVVAVLKDSDSFPAARRLVNAAGRCVTPGFCDPHAHIELYLFENPAQEIYVRQGVTSVVNGNCGTSPVPGPLSSLIDYTDEDIAKRVRDMGYEWESIADYFAAVDSVGGLGVNCGMLMGHGYLRWMAMGGAKDRPMSAAEMESAIACLDLGMRQGALGISSGLSYTPGVYSDMSEVVTLLEPVRRHEGVYATHIRYVGGYTNVDSYPPAVAEGLETARRAGVRLRLSHIDMSMTKCYDLIREAYQNGQDVTVDTITKSTGYILNRDGTVRMLKRESQTYFEIPLGEFEAMLRDEAGRVGILNEMEDCGFFQKNSKDIILVNTGDLALEGLTLAQAARERGMGTETGPIMLALLGDRSYSGGFMFGTRMDTFKPPYPLPEVITLPILSPGADLLARDVKDPFAFYDVFRQGSFPLFLRYCLTRGVVLEEAIRRMTSLPANSMGIADRGMLKQGFFADVLVFDPFSFQYPLLDDCDYSLPMRTAEGMDWVILNGVPVVEEGHMTGVRPGHALIRA